MKQEGYNNVKSGVENKYKYQGQERQDELGLNWDSFKYRNYDMAIGRFMSIDPLAEDYPYNSTYAFQENKLGLGTELEGKELRLHDYLAIDAVINPNGVGAHVQGASQGLVNSAVGLWNAVSHPTETAKGIGNTALWLAVGSQGSQAVDSALGTNSTGAGDNLMNSIASGTDKLVNGNGSQRGEVIGEVAGAIIGAKGTGAALKGVNSFIEAGTASSTGRVFWSGGGVAKNAAADFAAGNGMKTLEMTTKGGIMNTISPFLPKAISNPIWNNLSKNFAKGASGEVNMFTTAAGPRATSVWLNVEKPILQSNGVKIITNTVK